MKFDMDLSTFLSKHNVLAIVGATQNKDKYGYKVFKALLNEGYKVIPINPNYSSIEGVKCYAKLSDVKTHIDVVITIVPPNITARIIEQVKQLGLKNVWMQPGSEDKNCIELCKKYKLNCMYNMCFVVDGLSKDLDMLVFKT